jgi:aminoglycoside 6'-N-acetyltransferase I
MRVVPCDFGSVHVWATLRHELWPDATVEAHAEEAEVILQHPGSAAAFIAWDAQEATGFAEVALRHDYVNGCTTSPVAFLEGIYVRPAYRRQGFALLLCKAVEDWAVGRNCAELASDVEIRNAISQDMHIAAGFEETERVVYYRKPLPPR